jgi:hypothetical protein
MGRAGLDLIKKGGSKRDKEKNMGGGRRELKGMVDSH